MIIAEVTASFEECRLDKFLNKSQNLPMSFVHKIIRKGRVYINGSPCTTISMRVFSGYKIEIKQNFKKEPDPVLTPKKILSNSEVLNFKNLIIFENDDFLAINKPFGIAVQGGTKVETSLDEIVGAIYEEASIVHRIDKHTSGVLIFAKNKVCARHLAELFRLKGIEKTYYAVVTGIIEKDSFEVNEPLFDKEKDGYLDALTKFEVVKRDVNKQLTLVKVNPITGRKHQIRRHLMSIGFPVFGDIRYSVIKDKTRQLNLFAQSAKFENHLIEIKKFPKFFEMEVNLK